MSNDLFHYQVVKQLFEESKGARHAFVINSNASELEDALQAVKSKLKEQSNSSYLTIDAREDDPKKLLEEFNSLALFSATKVIVLIYPELLLAKVKEELKEALSSQKQQNILWAFSSKLTPTQLNSFKSFSTIIHKAKEKPWEAKARVEKKLQFYLKEKQISLEGSAFNYLLEVMSQNESRFDLELEKLYCFSKEGKAIKLEEVRQLVPREESDNFWELVDYIFKKDFKQAIRVIDEQTRAQSNAFQVLIQLRGQLQSTLLLWDVIDNKLSQEEFQKAYPYLKGSFLKKKMQAAQSFGKAATKKLLIELFEMELKLKNEESDPNSALAKLMTTALGAINV
ncbi:MAG: hypothetical protein L7U87_01220 [Chlamydiales bacterium]|nr:hypothetical protein [Chlamydiales bacterium]